MFDCVRGRAAAARRRENGAFVEGKIDGRREKFMEEGIEKLLELAVGQGIWAVLYIYLFFRMLSENKAREERYQSIIAQLGDDIGGGIERIQNTLDRITSCEERK